MEAENRMLIPPDEGESVFLGGLGAIHKLSEQATGGRFAIIEHPLQPGTLAAPPHTHTNEDEYSFVLKGVIGVRIGEEEFVARAGSYVLKPRGIPHTFWNPGTEPARIIEIIFPAGFEKYFDEIAEVLALSPGGPPDFNRIAEIATRYAA